MFMNHSSSNEQCLCRVLSTDAEIELISVLDDKPNKQYNAKNNGPTLPILHNFNPSYEHVYRILPEPVPICQN